MCYLLHKKFAALNWVQARDTFWFLAFSAKRQDMLNQERVKRNIRKALVHFNDNSLGEKFRRAVSWLVDMVPVKLPIVYEQRQFLALEVIECDEKGS